ncbi:MAG TPA: MmgE/PrpD family protein [Hyphomicrobiaceae bacterium]|nr:MmgE/PrpD family protein [Hyphomicrobiaceae bacterium]
MTPRDSATASAPSASAAAVSPAQGLAEFTAALRLADVPAKVRARALDLMLDAVGVGLAAGRYPFAARVLAGARALGGEGASTVIGQRDRLPLRDAALVNGVLLHGLDFDDTHLTAIVHPTVTCLPAALGVAEARKASGADMLAAYIAGMECAIRIGAAVKGGFHHVGFHATGVISHFSAALVAGRLLGLDPDALVRAQGIAASTAGGVQVFLEEGAWTKRLHPGWGAVAGITAATLAQNGFFGPSRAYEGRFGLFETHLHSHAAEVDLRRITAGLGSVWELPETSIKPYPICHFIHGAAEAAVRLHRQLGPTPELLAEVRVRIPKDTLPIVAEPVAVKTAPANDYDAKFSAQYVVATCLLKGRMGLAELEPEAREDPVVRALARRVMVEADPRSGFPRYMSGGVSLALTDGRRLDEYVPVNNGSGERALDRDGIAEKFFASAELTQPHAKAVRVRDAILALETISVGELAAALHAD